MRVYYLSWSKNFNADPIYVYTHTIYTSRYQVLTILATIWSCSSIYIYTHTHQSLGVQCVLSFASEWVASLGTMLVPANSISSVGQSPQRHALAAPSVELLSHALGCGWLACSAAIASTSCSHYQTWRLISLYWSLILTSFNLPFRIHGVVVIKTARMRTMIIFQKSIVQIVPIKKPTSWPNPNIQY